MHKNWHRRLFMKLLLRSSGHKVFRCPGVRYDAKNNAHNRYMKNGLHSSPDYVVKDRLEGIIGCWIAHSHALEDVCEQSGITVVLEDDFVCQSNFFENALRMVNTFERDFDIILFDTWGTGPLKIHKISDNIYSPRYHSYPYYGGTHCLFVNNARISKILEAKLNFPVLDYDGFLLGTGKLETYVFFTGQCASRMIGSDINLSNKLKYDLLGILICSLPNALKERTTKFKRYFSMPLEMEDGCLSEEVISSFEGYYEFSEREKINIGITIKNGQLTLVQPWDGREVAFQPMSEFEFISSSEIFVLKFSKDESGRVINLLINNTELLHKNNNYKVVRRKKIELLPNALKKFEGKYYFEQNDTMVIQITAMDGYLFFKQLWNEIELDFVAVSELEFFDRNNPLLNVRFIQDKEGSIIQIGAFFDAVIFTKLSNLEPIS